GYRYSRYCDLYRGWLRRRQVVLRHEHRAGEKLFVDYAGATIPIHNAGTGEAWPAALFVAVLGASSYTYAEASLSQGLADWIGAHMRAFEFMGGARDRGAGQSILPSRSCRRVFFAWTRPAFRSDACPGPE